MFQEWVSQPKENADALHLKDNAKWSEKDKEMDALDLSQRQKK